MELEFLSIEDEYQYKELYLQHINEMINIELNVGDTYNNLFEKLRKYFDNNPEKLKAVESWISLFNKEDEEDESDFNTVLCDEDKCYVVFNLRN